VHAVAAWFGQPPRRSPTLPLGTRDQNPSAQVLRALARVLRLDDTGTAHLLEFGAARPQRAPSPQEADAGTVPDGILKLLGTLPLPAFGSKGRPTWGVAECRRVGCAASMVRSAGSAQRRGRRG
jgi:hypothetical protein